MNWGPSAWNFLNTIVRVYPETPTAEIKEQHKRFFISLQNVLPCPKCRDHYKKNLELLPIDDALDSKSKLKKWIIDLHNNVNKSRGVPEMPFEEALDIVEGKVITNKCSYILYTLCCIFVLYLIYRFLVKKKKSK